MSIKKNPVRKRNIHLHFCVDEDEHKLIKERMAVTGIISMGAFMRKMSIDGYYITLDLSDIRELIKLLRNCTNNLNQLTKRANETGNIYDADIENLRQRYDALWNAVRKILEGLAKIK